jgi:phosphate transport system substrate-binding protein
MERSWCDAKIVAYSRESSSGTYEFFKEEVMDKKNYATILNLPATGAIVQAVGQTKCAWLHGLAYETKEVKQLAVLRPREAFEFCR